jgi:hypothetical protein
MMGELLTKIAHTGDCLMQTLRFLKEGYLHSVERADVDVPTAEMLLGPQILDWRRTMRQ